jgi:hypothetical protein
MMVEVTNTDQNSNTGRRRRNSNMRGPLFPSSMTAFLSSILSVCILFPSGALAFAPYQRIRTTTTLVRHAFVPTSYHSRKARTSYYSQLQAKAKAKSKGDAEDKEEIEDVVDDDLLRVLSSELVDDDEDGEVDWMTDREKARILKEESRVYVEQEEKESTSEAKQEKSATEGKKQPDAGKNRASPYTEEEEDVISAMGGRTRGSRKRESGFLGDSTLEEIATDYSVPICYLADVLCMWGVPVPINFNDRLGDLVTGEQAFAIVEAVNSLDIAALHDRYSNQNLIQICAEWDMDLQAVFEMAMKEGWSLPFGVQTCLRVEQEEELIRVLSTGSFAQGDEDEEGEEE